MTSFNLSFHIYNALSLIRENTIIFWFLGLLGVVSSLNAIFPDSLFYIPLIIIYTLLSIVAVPVIYGIYFEIIENRYSGIIEIGKKYTIPYLWLLIKLYTPIIFFGLYPLIATSQTTQIGYAQTILIGCSLLFIYIVPFFYVSGNQRGAIAKGISFLFNNLAPSAPLILAALLTDVTLLLFQLNQQAIIQYSALVYFFSDVTLYLLANTIDFTLFITMVFLLKNHQQQLPREQQQ